MAEFLALRRNTALLLAALVLAGTGEKLWIGFAPKYLQTLGATILVIGAFDALQTFLGAIYALPGGWLTDRFGQRRSLLLFNAIAFLGYSIALLWEHWLALFLGACLFLAWSALSLPATFAVVADSLEAHRHTMGIGVQSMVRRIPMMIGPLLGGWLVTRYGWVNGIRLALTCCIGLSAATALFQWFMSERIQPGQQNPRLQALTLTAIWRRFTPALRELLISDILIRFCERIPYAFVILWAMDHGKVSPQQFGELAAIEMLTAMICYIPVAHWADRYGRRPFVLVTFIFFTLFPLVLLVSESFPWLCVAFAVRGLKEFGEPARKALIIGEGRTTGFQARIYGLYYLIRDCIVTSGSFLGAWLWQFGPSANFLTAAALGGAGTIWFWWFVCRRTLAAEER